MKDSFVLFNKYQEVFDQLSNEEAGKLIKGILEYSSTGKCILSGMLKIIFTPIKQDIDRNNAKYEAVCERNKDNIRKRWNKENTKNTSGKFGVPKNTKNTDNDNDNDNEHDNESTATAVDNNTHAPAAATTDEVYVYYQNNIDVLTQRAVEIIEPYRKTMDDNLIIYAMKLAVEAKARRLNYVEGVLRSWAKKGITTLLQAQEEQERFKNNKAISSGDTGFKYYDSSGQYDNAKYYTEL